MQEQLKTHNHPEGLTEAQEKLADLLFETKIKAKVRRRSLSPDGAGFSFHEVERETSPVDFAQEGEFALKLHESQPGAPLSPIYINLRNLPPNILDQVGKVLVEISAQETPDFCVGIPTAGVPLAERYSEFSGVPLENIFAKTQTEEGRRIVATEEVKKGERKVRLIDDLVTQAHTKLEAIKAAEDQGFRVVDILVLVDREQGGPEELARQGYTLHSALKLSQLLRYYLRTGRIDQVRFDEVASYLSPQ